MSGVTSTLVVAISISPVALGCIASPALTTRFIRICSMQVGSASRHGRYFERLNLRATLLGTEAERRLVHCDTTAVRSTSLTMLWPLPAYANNCRVRYPARSDAARID